MLGSSPPQIHQNISMWNKFTEYPLVRRGGVKAQGMMGGGEKKVKIFTLKGIRTGGAFISKGKGSLTLGSLHWLEGPLEDREPQRRVQCRPVEGRKRETSKTAQATLLHFPAPRTHACWAWLAAAGTGASRGLPRLCRGSPQGLQCGLSCNGRGGACQDRAQVCHRSHPFNVGVGTA